MILPCRIQLVGDSLRWGSGCHVDGTILSASRLATHDQTSAYHEGTHRSNDSRGMLNVLGPRRRAMCWALGSACKTKLAYLNIPLFINPVW